MTGLPQPPGDESPSPLEGLARRLVVPFALGLLTLVALTLLSDVRALEGRLRQFDLRLLVPVLALSLVNYGVRFGRWQLFLRALGVRLSVGRSLAVFLVGLLLSVTPGKAGELGKAWLVRELGGGDARRVVPAVVAERITDLLGVIWLVVLGALAIPGGWWLGVLGAAVTVVGVALLAWSSAVDRCLALIARLPVIGPRTGVLADIYAHLLKLLRPGVLAGAIAMAVVAWGAEAAGFVIVVRSYSAEAGFLQGVLTYALATLAGAVSMLPGGLVASEGVMTAMLDAQGLDLESAISATLIIRAATLWFAVLFGLIALPVVWRQIRKIQSERAEAGARRDRGADERTDPPSSDPRSFDDHLR